MTLEKLGGLIEKLALFTMNGFEKMDKRFEQVESELSSVKQEVSSIDSELSFVKQKVSSIEEEQKETNRRLTSIGRKQTGTTLSLDETVRRSEFDGIVHRVEALEKK